MFRRVIFGGYLLSMVLLAGNCTSHPTTPSGQTLHDNNTTGSHENVSLPIHFTGYRALYAWIADDALILDKRTEEMLLKLAAESSIETRLWLDDDAQRSVMVIKADYLHGPYSQIRGAQDNGSYYVVTPTADGYDLVGILAGNTLRAGYFNGHPRFTTTWHMSAADYVETIYDWNGRAFITTSSRDVHVEDGEER